MLRLDSLNSFQVRQLGLDWRLHVDPSLMNSQGEFRGFRGHTDVNFVQ